MDGTLDPISFQDLSTQGPKGGTQITTQQFPRRLFFFESILYRCGNYSREETIRGNMESVFFKYWSQLHYLADIILFSLCNIFNVQSWPLSGNRQNQAFRPFLQTSLSSYTMSHGGYLQISHRICKYCRHIFQYEIFTSTEAC